MSFILKNFSVHIETIFSSFDFRFVTDAQFSDLFHAASGEPPLVLASSIHSAAREAIIAARMEFSSATSSDSSSSFRLEVPATMPVVKELCGLDNVEKYLENLVSSHQVKA